MRFQDAQNRFNAGELSPRLYGATDIARYRSAVKTLLGAYALPHGGANRWAGTQYVAAAKNATKKARLIPFVYSSTVAYVLEMGDGYMRFYRDKARLGAPYEITSPFLEADLPKVRYTQAADTMFLTCPGYYPRRLQRFGDVSWKLQQAPFVVEPHDEIGTNPTTTLTLGATSGSGISCTAAAACFQAADVGRFISSGAGYAKIVGYTSTTQVTVDIVDAFASVSLTAGNYTILISPQTTMAFSVAGPVGASVTLTAGAAAFNNNPQVSDIGRYIRANGGLIEITAVGSATSATGIVRALLTGTTTAPAGGWSLESKVWGATTGYPVACTLHEQRLLLAGTDTLPNTVWGTRTGIYLDFSDGAADDQGFAFDAFSEQQNIIQHLVSTRALIPLGYGGEWSMKGGTEKPITPTNVQVRNESSYGCSTLRPIKVGREVLFMQRDGRRMRALSYDAASDAFGSSDISILSEHITEGGITDICYAQSPDSVVAMTRADGTLVSLTINREQEVLGWGRRITDGAFESVCSIPYGSIDQIWAIVRRTVNGATVRYVEVIELQADHTTNRQTDASIVGSIASLGTSAGSWASNVVQITTSAAHGVPVGGWVRLEGMTPEALNGDWQTIAGTAGTTVRFNLYTDPGPVTVYGTLTPLATVWGGLSHLEAKTVDVVADGVVFPQAVVAAGQVTLPRAVASVEIGLHYDSIIELLPPEASTPAGSSQGSQTSINKITVRLNKSVGCVINGERIPFARYPDGLSMKVAPFTGLKAVPNLGWSPEEGVKLIQDQPLPFQVISVIRKITVTD